jgi:hypothetical protein
MSKKSQVLNDGRPSPIRNAPTIQSASGPGDRISHATEVAGFFRKDCRPLRDSLQLEMVAAQYQLRMDGVCSPEGIPVGQAVCAGVVAALEREGDALSHAILRALAYLGTGDTATRSADAVARLAEREIGLPPKFADVTKARAGGAWRASEGGYEGEYCLFFDFVYPQGAGHSLALFVEPRHGGIVKHIGLLSPISEIEYPGPMEELDIPAAGRLLQEVLDRTHERSPGTCDDYRVLIAAARARTCVQQPGATVNSS